MEVCCKTIEWDLGKLKEWVLDPVIFFFFFRDGAPMGRGSACLG